MFFLGGELVVPGAENIGNENANYERPRGLEGGICSRTPNVRVSPLYIYIQARTSRPEHPRPAGGEMGISNGSPLWKISRRLRPSASERVVRARARNFRGNRNSVPILSSFFIGRHALPKRLLATRGPNRGSRETLLSEAPPPAAPQGCFR
mgnify:CR=1 FL=1